MIDDVPDPKQYVLRNSSRIKNKPQPYTPGESTVEKQTSKRKVPEKIKEKAPKEQAPPIQRARRTKTTGKSKVLDDYEDYHADSDLITDYESQSHDYQSGRSQITTSTNSMKYDKNNKNNKTSSYGSYQPSSFLNTESAKPSKVIIQKDEQAYDKDQILAQLLNDQRQRTEHAEQLAQTLKTVTESQEKNTERLFQMAKLSWDKHTHIVTNNTVSFSKN
jgi:hypothetical protein